MLVFVLVLVLVGYWMIGLVGLERSVREYDEGCLPSAVARRTVGWSAMVMSVSVSGERRV